MKTIGPTFANELRAAGLFGLPFSWQEDGTINFGDSITAAQTTSVQSIYAAHDPLKADFPGLKTVETGIWMTTRDKMCGRLASIASRIRTSDPAGAASCDAVADSVLGLFTDPAVVAALDIAAYRLALKARYNKAKALATLSAAAEFGKYDK